MNGFSKAIAALLPLLLAAPALAGDYHKGATLACAQCHVMHFSQTHGYNANGTGFFTPLGGAQPHTFLLRDEVNNLCLACHDNNAFAPDVYGPNNSGNEPTSIRLAGYLNRVGDVTSGFESQGHTLDSLADAPGSSPLWSADDENGAGKGLNCVNCHHQHGSASGVTGGNAYRNLRTRVGNVTTGAPGYVDYAVGTNDLTKDVFERGASDYDEAQVDWNEPDTSASAIASYCAGCHSNFHGALGGTQVGGAPDGPGGAYEEFIRHPSAGVNIGAIGGGHSSLTVYNARTNKVKVMSALGVWNPGGANDVTPTCITCHKAHGNGNAFGLIFRSGSGTKTENGDSNGTRLENLCAQCHVQASAFVGP
ncbi:MAG: hypothetical protein NTY35_02290 [Planctomycetota bacterium]|nr:hypothetical protein [Planctomycetota bacterium]